MIRRYYPCKIVNRYKYSKKAIKKFNELKKEEEFLKRYELFERNIDYRTGEKITQFATRWYELADEFTIKSYSHDCMYTDVYFGCVENIDYEDYLKECDEIDKKNTFIKNRNDKVPKIIKEIDSLKYWEDYVLFDGKKYGVRFVINNIHRENDCFGNVKQCNRYRSRNKCDKCNEYVE